MIRFNMGCDGDCANCDCGECNGSGNNDEE